MWVRKRHKIVFAILRPFFKVFLFFRFGYRTKNYPLEKKPYLILCNHQNTLDPFNLALSFKRPIYYMASEDLFNKKIGSYFIKKLVAPIPKKKSLSDMQSIRDCVRISKEGGTIGIFPEGNRTYSGFQCYIDPATVKLIRLLKLPVILYNIKGGYGVEPRWASNIRRGKSFGYVKEIIETDEIKSLSDEELYERIKDGLRVVETPNELTYRSKKQAEKLERVLYLCPNCGKVGTIYSGGKKVKCHNCDLDVKYTDNLTLVGNVDFNILNEWYTFQEEYIENYEFKVDDTIFADSDIKLYDVTRGQKKELIVYGQMEIQKEGLFFYNNRGNYTFKLSVVSAMTVLGKNKLNFYIENRTYQIKGDKAFNALKYMQVYYKLKGERNELFRL